MAFIQLFARSQHIGNILECGSDSGLVSNDLCLLAQLGYVKIGSACAPVKDRQGNRRYKSPNTRTVLRQTAQLVGNCTDRVGQAGTWGRHCAYHADISIGLLERAFSRTDIRTVE